MLICMLSPSMVAQSSRQCSETRVKAFGEQSKGRSGCMFAWAAQGAYWQGGSRLSMRAVASARALQPATVAPSCAWRTLCSVCSQKMTTCPQSWSHWSASAAVYIGMLEYHASCPQDHAHTRFSWCRPTYACPEWGKSLPGRCACLELVYALLGMKGPHRLLCSGCESHMDLTDQPACTQYCGA